MNSPRAFLRIYLIMMLCSMSCSTSNGKILTTEKANDFSASMAAVDAPDEFFWIDRFENSIVHGFAVSSPNGLPATTVTLAAARQHCETQGKRLCTERQWMNACFGGNRLSHAYGSQPRAGICNVAASHLSPTGLFRRCLSDGQIYDMLGNVMEWVESDANSESGMLAGGSFRSGLQTSCFTRKMTTVHARSMEAGFRCCVSQ